MDQIFEASSTGDTGAATNADRLTELSGQNLIGILDEETVKRIVEQTIADRSEGKLRHKNDREPKFIERQKAYRSDKDDLKKRFPDLEQVIEISDSSVQDVIESIMPSYMRTFHSAEKVLNLVGVTEEDDEPATTMEDLIEWQLNRKNNFWLTSYDWGKTVLIENFGVLKVWWKREEKLERYQVIFDEEELMALKQDPKVQVVSEEMTNPADPMAMTPAIYKVTYDLRKRLANHPVVEGMPNSELYFDPDCTKLEDANYAIHHKAVTVSFLRSQEKQGIFANIDEAKEKAGAVTKSAYETTLNPTSHPTKKSSNDAGRKQIDLYECYEKISINLATINDTEGATADAGEPDELVDLIVTLAGDVPVRIEINTMGSHPFIDMSAIRDPHKVDAHRGLAELIREVQDLKSVLLIQMVLNTICNNDRQVFIDYNKIMVPSEVRDNEKVVQVDGNPKDVVAWTPQEPFSAQVMALMQYAADLLEKRVGVTSYNQGTDANSLNKTATGINMIMQAANQRMELIFRICAETGYSKLFRRLVFLNQKFIDEETVIRVTNKNRVVRPDNLEGDMDIIVNSGIGTGPREAELQSLQFLLSTYEKLVASGIATREHVAYVMGKIVSNLGFKNISDFIKTKEEIQLEDQQIAQQQAVVNQLTGGAVGPAAPGGARAERVTSPADIDQLRAKLSGRPA